MMFHHRLSPEIIVGIQNAAHTVAMDRFDDVTNSVMNRLVQQVAVHVAHKQIHYRIAVFRHLPDIAIRLPRIRKPIRRQGCASYLFL
jgi:hypothetical protein